MKKTHYICYIIVLIILSIRPVAAGFAGKPSGGTMMDWVPYLIMIAAVLIQNILNYMQVFAIDPNEGRPGRKSKNIFLISLVVTALMVVIMSCMPGWFFHLSGGSISH